ncbi:MAG: hypothetical protein IIZ97_02260 [Prevotella sp.]|nr:hypothetical protein [Prevotella sp.]
MADVITRLRVESSEYDSKIKRASQGLLHLEQACRKVGGTLAVVEKDELEFVRSLGKMETVSRDARGQIGELTKGFTDLSMMYKRLTDEEKKGDFGKALSGSLDQLKTRIQETKKDLADINQELSGSKFGQFGSLIDGVGKQMGLNANITELLTSKTALLTAGVGAGIAIVGKATEAWASYNAELAKQDQITTVTTGLKGSSADTMTDQARALSDTYGVDFREAINAANTLMTQFGQTGEQAMSLIRDGMQGMIQGDGPKLLSMIQQYSPAFRDAGVSASQLVAVIQNSEGGIFTDQNMNAIVMGIKNIRLMTKATSDALAQLGIDGHKMSQQLSDGSLTIFDALKQVATQIQGVNSNSQAAGEVMQQVFGRQGAMAGTKLGEAIATLNTNLNETKRQTGDLGAAFAELQTANERLNKAIREAFEYDGWEQMTVGIKTGLLDALSSVLETTIKIKDSWVGNVGKTIFNTIGSAALETMGPLGRLLNLIRGIKREVSDTEEPPKGVGLIGGLMQNLPERVRRPMQEADDLRAVEDTPARQEAHRKNLSRYDVQIAEQQQKVSALGDSSLVPEIQEAIVGEKKRLKELQQMRDAYAREAEKILAPKVEVKVETQDATTSIKELTAKLKELRAEREKARQAGDVEKVKSLDSRISTVSGDIKLLRGSVSTPTTTKEVTIQQKISELEKEALTASEQRREEIRATIQELDRELAKQKEIVAALHDVPADAVGKAYKDMLRGARVQLPDEAPLSTARVGIMPGYLTQPVTDAPTALQAAQYEAAKAVKAEDVKVDTSTLQSILRNALQEGIDTATLNLDGVAEQIGRGINVPDETWQGILDEYNALREAIGQDPIEIDFKTGKLKELKENSKGLAGDWQNASSAIQAVGSALGSIEDPAAKVAGIVAQAIATVALTFSKSLAGTVGPWDWIAAAAAGTATMVSTIATIKSSTKGGFAEGGIVPGNSFSGDNLRISDYGINSGELILSRSQQDSIAAQLTGDDGQASGGVPYVTGEMLFLGVSNTLRRQGRGEIVTTSMLRRAGIRL